MASDKSGYLRYKCGCGAILKIEVPDLEVALTVGRAVSFRPMIHRCDSTHEGIAVLIGGTYHKEQEPA